MASPTRTCIGCRQRATVGELVRLALMDGRVSPRPGAAPAGRGASIHPREACVVAAFKTQAFARAFRVSFLGDQRGPKPRGEPKDTSDTNRDDAVRALIKDIEVAHMLQQPRAGRTP